MRTIIDNINNGQIDKNFDTLTFSVSVVEHTLKAGTVCEGSFSVIAPAGHLTEGYVYSDDYRMECLTDSFSGSQDEISYRFHAGQLTPGEVINGSFLLVTNRGEYKIPFNIHIEAEVLQSFIGPVLNIMHFTNLAKARWEEAVELFYSPAFINILNGPDREYLPVYRCLSGHPGLERNVDEFLVAAGRKTPIEFIPSEKTIEINDPEGMSRFSVDIMRNGWGYTSFKVSSVGEFISLEVSEVSGEAFLGNRYQLYYYIDAGRLHSGHNFGTIIIDDGRSRNEIPVTVNVGGMIRHLKDMTRYRSERIVSLMELYSAHRLGKLTTRNWLSESTVIVEDMLAHDPEDLMAGLYRIHLLITQEHINEAKWNLKKIHPQAEAVKHEYSYLWCYFLYLYSLVGDNPLDIGTLTQEVEYCFRREPDNWKLCWLLAVMAEEYANPVNKLALFRSIYDRGCNSPAIFVEAAKIFLDDPSVVDTLDGFNKAVIRYICKQDVMSPDLVLAIRSIGERCKEYSGSLIQLLEYCYRVSPDEELLNLICTQLIKGNRRDQHAHIWYGYGVERAIRITRLYEYYMLSLDRSETHEIPRPVLLYFSFQSDLDYETNAYLYAYIAKMRESDADMYSKYQRQIEDYVVDQLKAGHNNRYLSILYRNFITDEMMADEDIARHMADVIFMHEVSCESPGAVNIRLSYDFKDECEVYQLRDGVAYIPIISDDCCIAVEYSDGRISSDRNSIRVERLMPPGRLLLDLQLLVRDHTAMDAHYCLEQKDSYLIRPENEFRYLSLLKKDYFSDEYVRRITMNLIRFYYERDRIEDLDAVLEDIDSSRIPEDERNECIRYLIERGQYNKAMEWIYAFGPERIDRVIISRLIHGWLPLHRDETGEQTALICQLLLYTLDSGDTNLLRIQFLMNHAVSTLDTLIDIWCKAGELSADRKDLEERIIIQMLFTGAYVREKNDILKSYAYAAPDKDILRAALTMECYAYFVDGSDISTDIIGVITDAMESDIELDRVCDLAYAQFYSGNRSLIDDRIRPFLKDSLHRLLADDVIVACFRDLAYIMPSMAPFADTHIVEYRSRPGSEIVIHYLMEGDNGDYVAEPMNEVYKGVYSHMFVVFFGETLDYYITETRENEEDVLTTTGRVVGSDSIQDESHGRFGLIDDMCMNIALRQFSEVDRLMEEYYRRDFISDRLFTMKRS